MSKPLLFALGLAALVPACGGLLDGSPQGETASPSPGAGASGSGGSSSGASGGGSAGHPAAAGQAGSASGGAGQGGGEPPGCGWYGQMVAGLGGLKGPVLVTQTGAVSLSVPAQTEDGLTLSKLTRFVEVWDTEAGESHALALGETSGGPALLHLVQGEPGEGFTKATLLVGNVAESFRRGGGFYFTAKEGPGESKRRLSRWNRYYPDLVGQFSAELTFSSPPFQLAVGEIPDGPEQLFVASKDRIVWVSSYAASGAPASEITVNADEEVITGVSVLFPSALFYATARAGAAQGRLYKRSFASAELSVGQFSPENQTTSQDIPLPGAVGGDAVVTQGGLLRFWDPLKGSEQLPPVPLVEPSGLDFLRLSHLENDAIVVDGEWTTGYLFDVRCKNGGFAPLFLDFKGTLSHRASESGFPFVTPAPWADSEGPSEAARIPSNKRGLYLVL